MSTTAEKVADSVWLRLVARAAMALVGMLIVPAVLGAVSWARTTGDNIDGLASRVLVLETSTKRGREDREKFQDQTTQMLQELLRSQQAGNERLARIEARQEAQEKRLDRERP